MQTFLPYSSFAKSARALDNKRLGKQRVEALQILYALTKKNYGWQHHPAVKMWKGHEAALCQYGIACCLEWQKRGFQDNCLEKFYRISKKSGKIILPVFIGKNKFHKSHKAALLFKNNPHYSQFGWKIKPEINYCWPSR